MYEIKSIGGSLATDSILMKRGNILRDNLGFNLETESGRKIFVCDIFESVQ
jgi:hypothetical protein